MPDVLRPHLRIVFCGTAAGEKSAQIRQYFAHPTNKFWKTLRKVGLTSRQLLPNEFEKMLDFELGLTDLAKCTFGRDSKLKEKDFDVAGFRCKIEHFQPENLAFVGKKAGRKFYGLRDTDELDYGLQAGKIGATRIWVLPSTAGGNGYWKLEDWRVLAASVK